MSATALASRSILSATRLQQARDEALTYAQFAESVSRWREELALNFEAVAFDPEERTALSRLRPALDVLAIVEGWCPDVITALPILARVEQDTSAIRLRVLIRPAYQDIADAYPHSDGRSHIPTFVFFDQDGEERGIFIERPDSLNSWVRTVFRSFVAERAGPDVDASDPKKVPAEIRQAAADALLIQRRTFRAVERAELVKAIRAAGGA